jgi:hypothetical protein
MTRRSKSASARPARARLSCGPSGIVFADVGDTTRQSMRQEDSMQGPEQLATKGVNGTLQQPGFEWAKELVDRYRKAARGNTPTTLE